MPMTNKPVIIFMGLQITGNKMGDAGVAGTALDFSIPQVCSAGTMVGVQFWPTGGASTIGNASFTINGLPVGGTNIPLAGAAGTGGGKQGSINLAGNLKDVNSLSVTATDDVGNATTANLLFYLRGASMVGAKKKAPAKKKAGGRKK